VERTVLDLQYVLSGAPDVFGDLVSMGGAKQQGSQYEHVERALELDPVGRFLCHVAGRYSTLNGNL
jgi:hypothetical protein